MKFDTTTETIAVQQFSGMTTTIPKGDTEDDAQARFHRFEARIDEMNRRAEYGWTHSGTVQIDNERTVTIYDTFTAEKVARTT